MKGLVGQNQSVTAYTNQKTKIQVDTGVKTFVAMILYERLAFKYL